MIKFIVVFTAMLMIVFGGYAASFRSKGVLADLKRKIPSEKWEAAQNKTSTIAIFGLIVCMLGICLFVAALFF